MDLKRLAVETGYPQSIVRFSVNSELLIEAVDEGALVFDLTSGATTLINQNALFVIDTVRRLGQVNQSDLDETCGAMLVDASDLSSILASLEKIRLISRC